MNFLTFFARFFVTALYAAPTDAYQRSDITNELEDISDVISDVSPEEVPFQTNAGSVMVDNTYYEFDSDVLPTAVNNNAHIDGDTFTADAITAPTRKGAHCQIARKDFVVTRRARKLNKTGQRDELARQTVRFGRALRRDIEMSVLANNASVADNGTVAPETGGLPTWIEGDSDGRADRGAGGSEGGFAATLTTAATDGTDRAMDESGMLDIVTNIFKVSKMAPEVLMLGPEAKAKFSRYMFSSSARIATPYQNQAQNPRGGVRVVGAVDSWVTDYAVLDVVPNLWQREDDGFFLNFDSIDMGWFDRISTNAMAKNSDSDSRMIVADYCLIPRNELTIGIFADIDETLAMVA